MLRITFANLKSPNITRPNQPKGKPYVERFIGTLQKECLDTITPR